MRYADRPSARLAAKSGWGNSGSMRGGRGTTAFSRAYARGDVSRYFTLNHGSIKHSLDWRTPPDELRTTTSCRCASKGCASLITRSCSSRGNRSSS